MIKDVNVRVTMIQLFKRIGVNLCVLGLGNDFLDIK